MQNIFCHFCENYKNWLCRPTVVFQKYSPKLAKSTKKVFERTFKGSPDPSHFNFFKIMVERDGSDMERL